MKSLNTFICIGIISILLAFTSEDNTSLYKQSLLYHLSNTNTNTVYVLKNFDIELPSKVGKYNLIEVEDAKILLKGRESLYAIKLMPIQANKGLFEVVIIDYLLREKEGEITMSNLGSEVFSYSYDYKAKQYKLVRKRKNNI